MGGHGRQSWTRGAARASLHAHACYNTVYECTNVYVCVRAFCACPHLCGNCLWRRRAGGRSSPSLPFALPQARPTIKLRAEAMAWNVQARVSCARLMDWATLPCQIRQRGDSNPCGQSPMDFESISLAARTHCLDLAACMRPPWRRATTGWDQETKSFHCCAHFIAAASAPAIMPDDHKVAKLST